MKNILIFVAGVVVGAAVGTTLTVLAYQKQKKNESEKKDGEVSVSTHEDAIVTSPEELRAYYIQQLMDLGCAVVDAEVEEGYDSYFANSSSSVNPVEEEEEDEENTDSFVPIDPNPEPYEIVDREFGNKEFYDSETLVWYRGDETMCSANDLEIIIDWPMYIGDMTSRLNGCRGDSLYFRNEVQQTDYEVKINKDSYKHAIEGEDDEE